MYQVIDNDNEPCDNTCLICFHDDMSGNRLISLSDLNRIDRTCKCDARVHKECVLKWYISNARCVVCNSEVTVRIRQTRSRHARVTQHEVRRNGDDRHILCFCGVALVLLIVLLVCFGENVQGFVLLSNSSKTDHDDKYFTLIDFH